MTFATDMIHECLLHVIRALLYCWGGALLHLLLHITSNNILCIFNGKYKRFRILDNCLPSF